MMKTFIGLIIVLLFLSHPVTADECVILLHGLTRTHHSMSKIESALQKEGYYTVNINYPSTKYNIEKLSTDALSKALLLCPTDSEKIHVVTHSLGGILLRQYLSEQSIERLGRVVMLGPPNQGSQVVDKMKKVPGFKLLNGPAGLQLGTDEQSIPNQLGPVDFETGIIAGTSSINLILSTMIPNPNDGKVSVESTKVEGMTDHITMPVNHSFMMRNKKVINQVIYFLKQGAFNRDHSEQ